MESSVSRRPLTSEYEFETPYPFPPGDRASMCRFDARTPLMGVYARESVMGGAPYLHEGGAPQYPPDVHDTPLTYPLKRYVGVPIGPNRTLWATAADNAAVARAVDSAAARWRPSVPSTPEAVGYIGGRCSPASSSGHSFASAASLPESCSPQASEVAQAAPGHAPETTGKVPALTRAPTEHRAACVIGRSWHHYVLSMDGRPSRLRGDV